MGFLNQLKSQASELQSQQVGVQKDLLATTNQTEAACQIAAHYLRDKEVFDSITMGWSITPKMGVAVGGSVSIRFLPEVERVQQILTFAHVEHARQETRHPVRNSLQSVRFEYTTQARGNISIKADHDAGQLVFRMANVDGFGITTHAIDAHRVTPELMDELAKRVVAQPSTFA